MNASYRFNARTVRQIDVATQWPISAGWYGVARYNYSFLDKRLLEGLAGVEYNAGCWVVCTVMTQVQAASKVTSTGFFPAARVQRRGPGRHRRRRGAAVAEHSGLPA